MPAKFAKRRGQLATKKYVKNLLDKRIEDKSHENTQGLTPGQTPATYVMSQIAAGTGESNRIGTEVMLKSVHLRGIAEVNGTATENKIRIIIFQDMSPHGS